MHQYLPEGKRSGMKAICLALFAVAVILFLASGAGLFPYHAFFQFGAVTMMALAITLMGRYLLRHYLYRVADDGEGLDFTVDELSRRGRYTVCRLSLSLLAMAEPWSDETRPRGSSKVYNYCVEIHPTDSWILRFDDTDGPIYIRLSPDETLIGLFREAVARHTEAALQESTDDEEDPT